MSAPSDDPFAVLGLQPTLDAAAVRRAWMQAVRAHPPHADPEGFQRARAAYEAVNAPERLRAAWLAAPFDPAAALRDYEAHDAERMVALRADIEAERARTADAAALQALPRRFGQVIGTWSFARWVERPKG